MVCIKNLETDGNNRYPLNRLKSLHYIISLQNPIIHHRSNTLYYYLGPSLIVVYLKSIIPQSNYNNNTIAIS